jgi:hypothetical protein
MPSFRSNIVLKALVARFGAEGEKLYSMGSGSTVQTIVRKRESLAAETVLENDRNDIDLIIQKVRITEHYRRREISAFLSSINFSTFPHDPSPMTSAP